MKNPSLSFEFFPPRTEAQSRRFWRTLGCLETLSPSFFSVTYGALGSASQASLDTVAQLQKDSEQPVAAHLTCAGQTRAELLEVLVTLKNMNVNHIVALRGDLSENSNDSTGKYYKLRFAIELVELISEVGGFDVSVAAYPEVHPEAASAEIDMQVLKAKLDAGASRALTQFFFEPEVFLRWRDSAVKHGIDKPLIPGILPVHDIKKVQDFSRRCGATVPPALVELFSRSVSQADQQRRAIDHCVDLCRTLQAEGVNNFHLYTLNQSDLSYEVSKVLLGVTEKSAAA